MNRETMRLSRTPDSELTVDTCVGGLDGRAQAVLSIDPVVQSSSPDTEAETRQRCVVQNLRRAAMEAVSVLSDRITDMLPELLLQWDTAAASVLGADNIAPVGTLSEQLRTIADTTSSLVTSVPHWPKSKQAGIDGEDRDLVVGSLNECKRLFAQLAGVYETRDRAVSAKRDQGGKTEAKKKAKHGRNRYQERKKEMRRNN